METTKVLGDSSGLGFRVSGLISNPVSLGFSSQMRLSPDCLLASLPSYGILLHAAAPCYPARIST